MARNTSFALGDHFVDFIDQQVASGRYASASEVIREGLRLLENREAKLADLRKAIQEGEDSGPAREWTRDELLADVRRRAAELGKV